MKKIILSTFFCICAVLFWAPAMAKDKPLVIFANPASQTDAFFSLVTGFMQAAADDLGFELKVYYGNRNHVLIDENIKTIYNHTPKPDYVIGMNARDSGEVMLMAAEKNDIKTIFFNQTFLAKDRTFMGIPGERFKNWLFEFVPDDVHAGYLLGTTLINAALEKQLTDKNGTLQLAAISGQELSAPSALRLQGLRKAVSEYNNVLLDQIVSADWKQEKAHHLTLGLLNRYPEVSVIWSASDVMALGILDGMKSQGATPGKDMLTGGVDWANSALPKVKNGEFTATVGGHFMDGGWALVMLYDLMNGITVPRMGHSRFSVLTQENVDEYSSKFGDNNWSQIDFRKFSKHLNPQIKEYKFNLEAILEQAS